MIYILAIALCLMTYSSSLASNIPDEALMVLKSRKILGTVNFLQNQSRVSNEGHKSIGASLSELNKYKSDKIIRVEGFCKKRLDVDEIEAVETSMKRAKIVCDVLAAEGYDNVFITGFGTRNFGQTGTFNGDRVEIAVYDKIMDIEGADVIENVESLVLE